MRMSVVFVKDKELEKQEKIFVVISVLTVVKFMNTLKVGKKILGIDLRKVIMEIVVSQIMV